KDGEFQVFVHGGFLKTPAFRVEASCTSSKQTAETLSGRLRLGFHRLLQLSPERRGASRFLDGRQTRRMGGQFVIAGADDSGSHTIGRQAPDRRRLLAAAVGVVPLACQRKMRLPAG